MWVQLVSPVGNLGGYPGRRAIDCSCLPSDRLIMGSRGRESGRSHVALWGLLGSYFGFWIADFGLKMRIATSLSNPKSAIQNGYMRLPWVGNLTGAKMRAGLIQMSV